MATDTESSRRAQRSTTGDDGKAPERARTAGATSTGPSVGTGAGGRLRGHLIGTYGLLTGRPPEEALRLGWAHGALLTTFPGDVTMAKLDEVEALAKGGSARVQR
jgi:hypothetical protein